MSAIKDLQKLLNDLPLDEDQRQSIRENFLKMDEEEALALQNQISCKTRGLLSIASEIHGYLAAQ